MTSNGKTPTPFERALAAAEVILKSDDKGFVFSSDQFSGINIVRALLRSEISPRQIRDLLEQRILIDNRLVTKVEIFMGIEEFLTIDCRPEMSRAQAGVAQDAILEIFDFMSESQEITRDFLQLITQKIDELPADMSNEVVRNFMRAAEKVLEYGDHTSLSGGKRGFLALHSRMFIANLRSDDEAVFNRFFSQQELTNIFAFATPPKIELLAYLHAARAMISAKPTFQYLFDPVSEEHDGLTIEQRQRLAEEFVDRLADLLSDDPVLLSTKNPPQRELPKETIVKVFGEAIARNRVFNGEIIKGLGPTFEQAFPSNDLVAALY